MDGCFWILFFIWRQMYCKIFISALVYLQRQGYTMKLFFQSISWNTVLGEFHETWNTLVKYVRARLHESQCEVKPIWNLKPLWQVVPFTWHFYYYQPWHLKLLSKIVPFRWRFHCGNFPSHSKIVMHMGKW